MSKYINNHFDIISNRQEFALTDEEDEEQKVKYDVVDMFNVSASKSDDDDDNG